MLGFHLSQSSDSCNNRSTATPAAYVTNRDVQIWSNLEIDFGRISNSISSSSYDK